MDRQDLVMSLSYTQVRLTKLPIIKSALLRKKAEFQQEIEKLDRGVGVVALSREFHASAVDFMYQKSVGELVKVMDLALAYVFTDKVYKTEIVMEDKRGQKNLLILLKDKSKDSSLEIDVKDGIGAGVRSVLSFVLHTYYLVNRGFPPILFLDEAYSQISAEYIDRFFSFVKAFSKRKNLVTVLVSHDERFRNYADRIYRVADGRVEVVG